MNTLLRYWHTLRWLRPVQVWGRLWFRFHRPRPDTRPAPPLRTPALGTAPSWRAGWLACARTPSMTGPASFRFLSVERELGTDPDWDRADWPRLWRYNLHYFDDLVAEGAAARTSWHEALIARWIAENPPGRGSGWEPYPASLRIVNWIKWALAGPAAGSRVVAEHATAAGEHTSAGARACAFPRLSATARASLATQVRWLRARLEIHLLGNHLWANAKALVFAGTFFDGSEAERWRSRGLALVRRELAEQILPDGGHFERSPMYHAILLEDVLDLVQLADSYPGVFPPAEVARWRATAARMLAWLRVMTHPDGGIAFFNDAALGIAPDLAALEAYAAALGIPLPDASLGAIEVLPQSGYVRLQAGAAVLIADVGPIGPDYLPGHAHADTLSFELSLAGRRVLVNSGTSTYDVGPERLRQRGTAAHNTVVVDGADSSEVWSSFRVARRARVHDLASGQDGDGTLWLAAAHDGYRRLPARIVHRREWRLRDGELRIVDVLEGGACQAEARFHLHPEAQPADIGADLASFALQASSWHPRFGAVEPAQVLVGRFAGSSRFETAFAWSAAQPPA